MKKIHFPFAVLIALVLPLAAWGAKETVDGIEWTYKVVAGTASVGSGAWNADRAVSPSTIGAITIPSTLGGYPVRTIGDYAFSGCNGLTSVAVPDDVTSIGASAFSDCSALTSVTLPPTVTSIGSYAFYECSGLTNPPIPGSVTNIGSYAFYRCSGLTSVSIPNSLTSIGEWGFFYCSGLTNVTIGNAVTSIGSFAFCGCSGLTEVTIPDSVEGIWNGAFMGCIGLTNVTIGNGVTSIGRGAFRDCSGLTSMAIPDRVTDIWNDAFSGCIGLTSMTIPDSVTSIWDGAFSNCSSLVSITIGNSVTNIGYMAFDGCDNLREIVIRGNVPENLDGSELPSRFRDASCRVSFSEAYGAEWNCYFLSLEGTVMNYDHGPLDHVYILSVKMRVTDPTILDVVYKVTSANDTVNVRALAFEDGERSFAKVLRPETFVEGTGANLGDGIAANVEHTLSWRVSADWVVDLAKVSFEILVSDEGQLPVELVTIPAAGGNSEMTINVRRPFEEDIFNALLWHYADHAEDLTVSNGALKHGTTTLANGAALANSSAACGYVYGKMGYDLLTGDALSYARSATRWPLAMTTKCQYGVLRAAGE